MSTAKTRSVGQRLRYERERLNYSQEELAEQIGTTALSINRWEHDKTLPLPHYRAELCRVFNKSAEVLFDLSEGEEDKEAELLPIWNVPYMRNLYFTGREDVLAYLHQALCAKKTVALMQPHAISGLGGIGKTQTAVEYAYRYGSEYKAVLWARADFHKSLVSDFVAFAALLNLPERNEADQSRVVSAVKRWLQEHTQWLLILDNADDLEVVYDFLPTRGRGHTLLTSRAQATGPSIKGIELEKMGCEEGTLFLLRRAKIVADDAMLVDVSEDGWNEAEAICELMDGLPLALDQAAAYIEENQCSFADYFKLYQTRRTALLKRRGALSKRDYPKSVATTWSLSFEQVERADSVAADLLRLCAFLHPDAIAETMILEGAAELGPVLQSLADDPIRLDEAIGELRKYSLVQRNSETKTLTIHRLVQTVLKDAMSREIQRAWAEQTVRVVSKAFPDPEEVGRWPICEQCLPHMRACAELMEQWNMAFAEAAQLLHRAGAYLYQRGQYTEAELPLQRALAIREQVLGRDHPDIATSLYNLAFLSRDQGKHEQAKLLFQHALEIRQQVFGPNHPNVAECLNNLAWLYYAQGKYEQAESFYQRGLVIYERVLGPNSHYVGDSLNGLALLYGAQSKYEQAEPLMQRSLVLFEQVFGSSHPNVAVCLNNLARLYAWQGKYEQAEPLIQRALAIFEQVLGSNHFNVAICLNDLALLYGAQSKYEQAEPLIQRALAIFEQVLGSNQNHPRVATSFNGLASVYAGQGKYEQAESLYQGALAIFEQMFGSNNPDVAQSLNGLASLYAEQGKYEQAEPLFQRALAIREESLGPKHPSLAATLEGYADLLRKMGREGEAVPLEERAKAIRANLTA